MEFDDKNIFVIIINKMMLMMMMCCIIIQQLFICLNRENKQANAISCTKYAVRRQYRFQDRISWATLLFWRSLATVVLVSGADKDSLAAFWAYYNICLLYTSDAADE